jgi:hypothetical protein
MPAITFTNILPDPNNSIGDAGQSGGSAGPGYSAVRLASEHEIMNTRTNSGRLVSRETSGHKWTIDISYNPMTREEFEPIYTFLLQKRGSLSPFFVSLPQYKKPRDTAFALFVASNNFQPVFDGIAGSTNLMIKKTGYVRATHGTPKPGDIITITDTSDSNHKKAYQITRVETESNYLVGTTPPEDDNGELRIWFTPSLQRNVESTTSVINFNNPLFRVILKNDVQEYTLDSSNLYSFSLKLEEAQA